MQSLLIFILSVSGLSWIATRSKICKSLRERITFKKEVYEVMVAQKNTWFANLKVNFFMFLENIFNCYGCFGFWAGIICYVLQKCNAEIVLYAFAGSMASLLLVGLFNFLDKK